MGNSRRIGVREISGCEVYLIDISSLSGIELITCCRDMTEDLNRLQGNYNFFIDITSCKLNIESLSFLKSAGKNIQSRVLKSGIVGVNSHIRPFFSMYLKYTSSGMKVFLNKQSAIKYLIE